MSDLPINVDNATRSELIDYAAELGLRIPDVKNVRKADIRQLVADSLGVTVSASAVAGDDAAAAVAGDSQTQSTQNELRAQRKVPIVIADEQGAQPYVPVWINGVQYTIKRGVRVEVPESVVGVLENARRTVITQERAVNGHMENKARLVPSYPFQRVA